MRALLGAVPYRTNEVYLHTDADLMPRRRATWASWNFLGGSGAGADCADVCVTYWLNNLQVWQRDTVGVAQYIKGLF